ncbi:MAG TPA: hypothetical protein VLA43_01240 [Longimicrobiales bacterium]|nr:hypothetical protein [Longimicrobiales bacterium]
MSMDLQGRPLSSRVPEPARAFSRGVVRAGGGAVVGVILYGSRLQRSSPGLHSAWDLVVVVDRYAPFHRAMKAAGYHHRPEWLMNFLGRVLPPYVTDFSPEEAEGVIAKCLVLSVAQFERALSPHARDHFLKGRLVQHVEVVWTASPSQADRIDRALAGARWDALRWAGPFLQEPFDAASFTRTMLAVSFAGEIRPESRDRAREVWASQDRWLEETYAGLLADAVEEGSLVRDPSGAYRLARRPGRLTRLRLGAYFFWSKVRVTARWGKHILTFNDWLTYIQRKAERRTGLTIELTARERRWPLLFLWPKVFWVLRQGRAEPTDLETPP